MSYPAGSGPRAIAVGDFNGDGRADLAVVNRDSGDVSIYFGNGDGTFGAPASYPAGSTPARLASGDFNGDGIPDLAIANDTAPGTVSVLFGDGRGGFLPPSPKTVGNFPYSVLVDDFNGDGRADIAVTDQCTSDVSILVSDGAGNFAPAHPYQAGQTPEAVASGDFNGDGIPDLAVADFYGGTASVLLGNGDGSFASAASVPAGAASVSVAVGDFNGDGRADIAVANRDDDTVTVLLGNGDGTFQPGGAYPVGTQPMFVATGDFDGDGLLDLAVANLASNDVSVLLGNGDGTFQPATSYPTGFGPTALVVFDFNGDGKPDIAVADSLENSVSLLVNTTVRLELLPPVLSSGTVGLPYAQPLSGSGGVAPYAFAVSSGSLPPGLTLGAASGEIAGVPTASGTADFTVDISDAVGCVRTKGYALTVACPGINLSPTSVPGAVTGKAYSAAISAVGGSGVFSFAIAAGELPPGLKLNASGDLVGTPTVAGVFVFSVRATDSLGCYGAASYTVAVTSATGPTVVSISPDCLSPSGGEIVTIAGTNFQQGASVSIAGNPAAFLTETTSSQLTVLAPAAVSGTVGSVLVTNPDGQAGVLVNGVLYDFLDVPAGDAFLSFVCRIARNEITAGCGAGNFCPTNPVLRASMAVFLLRGEHGATYVPPPASGFFTDLPASSPFAPWVERIYGEGIAAGCVASPLQYCPASAVSRASMAVFLLRAEHGSGYAPPAAIGIFADVPPSNPFAPWIEQLYNEGVTGGCSISPLSYCPADVVTRGSMAVFLSTIFPLS